MKGWGYEYRLRFEMWLRGGGAKRPGEEIIRMFLRGNAEKGAKKIIKKRIIFLSLSEPGK